MRKALLAGAGGVGAALLGSLCCIGPLLFVTLGVGAGLASTFEPLRPVFGVAMAGLLGVAFYTVYGKRPALAVARAADCDPGGAEACALPRSRAREKVILWTALVVALVVWAFPSWSIWLL